MDLMRVDQNATFYSFKNSGKWYATCRGWLSPRVFDVHERAEQRAIIVAENGGKYPGLSGTGYEFTFVVIPDEDCPHGFPLMLYPVGENYAEFKKDHARWS